MPNRRPRCGRSSKPSAKKFGREIGPADPVFFDPDSDTPKPIPEDLIRRKMAEAMAKAGISPEKVYAASKTGMLPTAENMHLWSAANLAEWNAVSSTNL